MITQRINPGIFEIEVTIKEIIFGNTIVDKYTGWDKMEATTLKLRCKDCTVMVFKKDFSLFRNISTGYTFKALVKEWKPNIYHFKKKIQ